MRVLTHSEQCIKADKIPKMTFPKMQKESVKFFVRRDEDDDLYLHKQPGIKVVESKGKKKRKADEYNEF